MIAEQRMWKMIGIFEKETVIKNIISCPKTMMAFNAIKSCLARDIELLKEELKAPIMLKKEISAEQAIGIVLICLMAEIDDSVLLKNYELLSEALMKPVKQDYEISSMQIQYFLTTGRLFSSEKIEYLVNLFF